METQSKSKSRRSQSRARGPNWFRLELAQEEARQASSRDPERRHGVAVRRKKRSAWQKHRIEALAKRRPGTRGDSLTSFVLHWVSAHGPDQIDLGHCRDVLTKVTWQDPMRNFDAEFLAVARSHCEGELMYMLSQGCAADAPRLEWLEQYAAVLAALHAAAISQPISRKA